MTTPLKVVHCLRAPVGGLFRHVCDLAEGQAERGLDVGIICDAQRGDDVYEAALDRLSASCKLGVHRFRMHRSIAPGDIPTALAVRRCCAHLAADIVHGHGAKGGAYARFAAIASRRLAFYTPHGGSLHYSRTSPAGFIFLTMERLLARYTDGLLFESAYGEKAYRAKVGIPPCEVRVIHNGVREAEFEPVPTTANAADFLFIGELRRLKGVDVLLEAIARLSDRGDVRLSVVGSGPDEASFKRLAADLGIDDRVTFHGPLPARDAFALGEVLVVPSRAESFPYIVLEALAAGKPVIATNVGGIPEMFGAHAERLVAPGDAEALHGAIAAALAGTQDLVRIGKELQDDTRRRFPVTRMTDNVLAFYRDCLKGPDAEKIPISAHHTPAE